MSEIEQEIQLCPVGEKECQWLDELSKLKQENEELKLLVTTDPLTGLFNYRYFRQILPVEMQTTVRSGRPTSIFMIDLDFFKSINDDWGHEVGNVALQTAATVFRRELRQSDIICRYGGEEFVIILPSTPLPIAVNVAERVRLSLENTPVPNDGKDFNMTASFGVSVFQEANEHTMDSLVESADEFLYQAKQQGRNQVCHPDYAIIKTQTAVSNEEKSALFNRRDDDPE